LVAAHRAEVISQSNFTANWLTANLSRLLKQGSESAFGTNLNSADLIADCIEGALQ
jgi:hypothetical protein